MLISIIADTTTDTGPWMTGPWLTLVNLGVLGLVVYFTFFRPKIHTESEFDGLRQQVADAKEAKEKADAENDRLHKLIEEGVIPALSRSTDLIARTMAEREKRGHA